MLNAKSLPTCYRTLYLCVCCMLNTYSLWIILPKYYLYFLRQLFFREFSLLSFVTLPVENPIYFPLFGSLRGRDGNLQCHCLLSCRAFWTKKLFSFYSSLLLLVCICRYFTIKHPMHNNVPIHLYSPDLNNNTCIMQYDYYFNYCVVIQYKYVISSKLCYV